MGDGQTAGRDPMRGGVYRDLARRGKLDVCERREGQRLDPGKGDLVRYMRRDRCAAARPPPVAEAEPHTHATRHRAAPGRPPRGRPGRCGRRRPPPAYRQWTSCEGSTARPVSTGSGVVRGPQMYGSSPIHSNVNPSGVASRFSTAWAATQPRGVSLKSTSTVGSAPAATQTKPAAKHLIGRSAVHLLGKQPVHESFGEISEIINDVTLFFVFMIPDVPGPRVS